MSRRFLPLLRDQMEELFSKNHSRDYRVMSSRVLSVQWCRRRNQRRGIVVLPWCLIQKVSPTRFTAAGSTQETVWTPYPFPTSWGGTTLLYSGSITWNEREMALQGRDTTLNECRFLREVLRALNTSGNFSEERNLISLSHLVTSGGQLLPKRIHKKCWQIGQ